MLRGARARAWFVLVSLAAAACGGGNGGTGGSGGGSGGAGGSGGMGGSGGAGGDPFAVDECALGLDDCAPDAECVDTPGFFTCTCKPGYEGDGKTCADVDECTTLLHDCDTNATCTNTPGAFSCACPAGFSGDGKTCDAKYSSVSAGQYHACAIRSDKTLHCWGLNTSGQVGTGTSDQVFLRPVPASGAANWVSVSAGATFTCALDENKRISCFGSGNVGQIGDGLGVAQSTPAIGAGGYDDWMFLSAGSTHACGIRAGGALYCWGQNNRGQIGDNTTNNALSPVLVDAGPWSLVSAGTEFTCGVKSNGSLHCWGFNNARQLGDGTNVAQRLVPTQEFTVATDWASVSAGNAFTCATKTDGTRHCWGANSLGQVGDGLVATVLTPKAADMATDWSSNLDVGDLAGCGQKKSGELHCWGDGSVGQTGQPGNEGPALTPLPIPDITDWVSISSGLRFACGVRQTGDLLCWGSASRGALGVGFSADRTEVTPVSADTDWERVDTQLDNGCAIRTGGKLFCWGRNVYGHLGDGTTRTRVAPVEIGAGKVWKRIALGRTHTCGIASEGGGPDVPYCWGLDGNGELGNGPTVTAQTVPTAVNATVGNDSPWIEIAAGYNHTCAVRQDKTLWCWGRNASGQLGDASTTTRPDPKWIAQAEPADWLDVVASGDFTCGLREGGNVFCWGLNNLGHLGQGDTVSPVNVPKAVPGTYAAIDAGANHTCGVRLDGTLWCWGRNNNGELGLGNAITPITTPTQVGNATDWARPFLGQGLSTCATKKSGDLFCWGVGSFGQLALGNLTSFNAPQKVPSLGPWKTLSLGNEHTCGIAQDGVLSCWGAAYYGQLGSGLPFLSTPTPVLDPI
ncbi:EGF domain-containing protein [Polyangium sp. 6x1]|uniref:RCC1 domain-containing protein n=1 Tax=Polyangium sp. 6x1 TaxID=3042689 RepID=UPI0024830D45|nr:EGF domain-containing protein [Polyangium sp. 6x1]MDI1447426.1 EGF domain-containing protein [Polyangium sp. 6x1]